MIHTRDDTQRNRKWIDVGNIDYRLHTSIPLFWLKREWVGNPKQVSEFIYPGDTVSVYYMLDKARAA